MKIVIMNRDEEFKEIINSLSDEGLVTTEDETIHITKKGIYEYFNALLDIYKKDVDTFKKNLRQTSENAMARVILRAFPKIEYEDAVLYHRLLCVVYPIETIIKSFVSHKLYDGISLGVERVMRERDVALTRAFTIFGQEIGRSTSWVRDNYSPLDY